MTMARGDPSPHRNAPSSPSSSTAWGRRQWQSCSGMQRWSWRTIRSSGPNSSPTAISSPTRSRSCSASSLPRRSRVGGRPGRWMSMGRHCTRGRRCCYSPAAPGVTSVSFRTPTASTSPGHGKSPLVRLRRPFLHRRGPGPSRRPYRPRRGLPALPDVGGRRSWRRAGQYQHRAGVPARADRGVKAV